MLLDKAREILESNHQCCLGTVHHDEPYLSLMIYTFMAEDEVLIMSSRLDSMKVRNIRDNPRAAVLIHEDETSVNPVSMTLIGAIRLEEGGRAQEYRRLHQQANPGSAQFISGEGVAVLIFTPERAVLADRQDRVTYWER